MIAHASESATDRGLPLFPALVSMTGLQALVALALFAPGVLAPKLALDVVDVGLFTTAVFATGMATSFAGGRLAARYGPCAIAAACAVATAAAMSIASAGTTFMLVIAGLVLGLAFGPETPASSTLLSKLVTDATRPLVFSIRQTGNQIGGMVGSLCLPLIATIAPIAGFWLIAGIAVAAATWFANLSRTYDPAAGAQNVSASSIASSLALVTQHSALRRLALASIPFSAMQLALNAFFVTFAVGVLTLDHVAAGILLAVAQAGGLIGRVFWGLIAARFMSSRRIVAGLGIGMAITAGTLACAAPSWPMPILLVLATAFGLTASGWNGVFLAEVARLAPTGRVAEATGAVLTASYAGLLVGPTLIAAIAKYGTLSASYAVLAAAALVAGLSLLKGSHDHA